MDDCLELAEVIAKLREELSRARNQAAGEEIRFSVGDIELEFQFVVTKSAEGGAGIKFWVVNADAKGKYEHVARQTLKLKLTSTHNGAPILMSAPDKD